MVGGMAKALDTAKQAAGGAADAIGQVDDRTAELAATLQTNVAQGLGQLVAGLITGATTLKDALGSVIARLGEMALTRGFETLLAGVSFGSGPIGQLASLILPARAAGRQWRDWRHARRRRRGARHRHEGGRWRG